MALVDILLAMPFILVAIVSAALIGPGLWNVLIVLTITGWVPFARVVHSQTLTLKIREFIEAAQALGASNSRILSTHILPQVWGPFVVLSTLQIGRMMLGEAALSFLGLGVEASRPSWGTMIGVSRDYIWTASWIVTFPGLAITLVVLGINLVGDWLRIKVDPRWRGV
jgi:peptide/nickel transport system permease protein